MKKAVSLDWQAWRAGKVQDKTSAATHRVIVEGLALGVAFVPLATLTGITADAVAPIAMAATDAVPTVASNSSVEGMHFNDDASWADYVIPLIKSQGLPLTITMVCWASLEMILRHPASAIDRTKWAVLGYLGLNFVLPFVKHLGHHFGDA